MKKETAKKTNKKSGDKKLRRPSRQLQKYRRCSTARVWGWCGYQTMVGAKAIEVGRHLCCRPGQHQAHLAHATRGGGRVYRAAEDERRGNVQAASTPTAKLPSPPTGAVVASRCAPLPLPQPPNAHAGCLRKGTTPASPRRTEG